MSLDVFRMITKYPNICKYVYLPVQSGSDNILKSYEQTTHREEYIKLIREAKKIVSDVAFSQDMIVGFVAKRNKITKIFFSMKEVEYDYGYMFAYSERPEPQLTRK